jgi:hypothetical protein
VARGGPLKVRRSVRIAALATLVFAVHLLALRWIGQALLEQPFLKPMTNPMFTRLLKPEVPRPIAVGTAPAAPAPKRRNGAITAVRAPTPARAASVVAAAEPAAQEASAAVAQASAPEPASKASEPLAPASAPVAVAAASAPASAASGSQAPASAAVVLAADSWPADTRLSYRLSGWYRGELTGSGRVQWQRENDRYQVRIDLDLGLFGLHFLSQGDVRPDSLSPRAYQESTPSRTRVVQLGPENVVINDGRTLPRPPGVQDTASQFVELSHRFSTGREQLEVGKTTRIWLARPGGVDEWTYDIVAREVLSTPSLGKVDAYHLRPRPLANPRGNYSAEIWFAPVLQYLPVRIRINEGSESYVDLYVDKIEQR